MTPRAFLTLAIVTVVAVIGAGWALVSEQLASNPARPSQAPVFAALADHPNDVSRVEIQNRSYKLVLEKRGNDWVAIELGDYPAKREPVQQLVASIAGLKAYEPKTDNPDWYKEIDVGDVGPGSAAVHVTTVAANGNTLADVLIGRRSRSIGANPRGGTFIREPGKAQAWLAEGTVFVPDFLQNWFDQIVHVPGPDVRSITILEGDKVVFDSTKSNVQTGEYEVLSLDPKYGGADLVANSNNIKNLSQGIVSTTFDNARALDTVTFPPDARTIRFKTADDMQLDVRLGTADGQTWVAYSASAPEGSAGADKAKAINDRTKNWAFLLPSYRVAALQREVTDLVQAPPPPPAPPAGVGPGGINPIQTPGLPGMPGGQQMPALPGMPMPGMPPR